jgi:CheY-like chemotaxis protein
MAVAKSLLIIEADLVHREGLAAVLRKEGYLTAAVADGGKALGRMRTEPPPDLILLDMMFPPPAHDGWYFMEQRKQIPALAAIPIVIVTGLAFATAEWAAGLGAVGFVRKPVDLGCLFAEVRRCCGLGPKEESGRHNQP